MKNLICAALAAGAAMIGAGHAATIGIIDQEFDPRLSGGSSFFSADAAQGEAQTFTVGLNGTLEQIDLVIGEGGSGAGDVVFQLTDGLGGDVLAMSTISTSSFNPPTGDSTTGSQFTTVFSGLNLPVTTGMLLAIKIFSDVRVDWLQAFSNSLDLYAGGALFDPDGTTNAFSNIDASFRTYVDPNGVSEVPIPGALVLMLSGLAGFGFAGRKTARGRTLAGGAKQ